VEKKKHPRTIMKEILILVANFTPISVLHNLQSSTDLRIANKKRKYEEKNLEFV